MFKTFGKVDESVDLEKEDKTVQDLVDKYKEEIGKLLSKNDEARELTTKEESEMYDYIADNIEDGDVDVNKLKDHMINYAFEHPEKVEEAEDGEEVVVDNANAELLKDVQKTLKSLLKKVNKALKQDKEDDEEDEKEEIDIAADDEEKDDVEDKGDEKVVDFKKDVKKDKKDKKEKKTPFDTFFKSDKKDDEKEEKDGKEMIVGENERTMEDILNELDDCYKTAQETITKVKEAEADGNKEEAEKLRQEMEENSNKIQELNAEYKTFKEDEEKRQQGW
jgi:hypothetical protein